MEKKYQIKKRLLSVQAVLLTVIFMSIGYLSNAQQLRAEEDNDSVKKIIVRADSLLNSNTSVYRLSYNLKKAKDELESGFLNKKYPELLLDPCIDFLPIIDNNTGLTFRELLVNDITNIKLLEWAYKFLSKNEKFKPCNENTHNAKLSYLTPLKKIIEDRIVVLKRLKLNKEK